MLLIGVTNLKYIVTLEEQHMTDNITPLAEPLKANKKTIKKPYREKDKNKTAIGR